LEGGNISDIKVLVITLLVEMDVEAGKLWFICFELTLVNASKDVCLWARYLKSLAPCWEGDSVNVLKPSIESLGFIFLSKGLECFILKLE
jgi:hypothetical protein